MTQKTRTTTLEQKLGFADADFTSPKHDQLMFMLDRAVNQWIGQTFQAVIIQKIWEYQVSTRSDFLVGFVDMMVHTDKGTYFFEVKPSVRSAGEVIRQVRLYQKYLRGKFFIVSPDSRFAPILEEQGIGFLEFDDGGVLVQTIHKDEYLLAGL